MMIWNRMLIFFIHLKNKKKKNKVRAEAKKSERIWYNHNPEEEEKKRKENVFFTLGKPKRNARFDGREADEVI